jgi:hypothetical protein
MLVEMKLAQDPTSRALDRTTVGRATIHPRTIRPRAAPLRQGKRISCARVYRCFRRQRGQMLVEMKLAQDPTGHALICTTVGRDAPAAEAAVACGREFGRRIRVTSIVRHTPDPAPHLRSSLKAACHQVYNNLQQGLLSSPLPQGGSKLPGQPRCCLLSLHSGEEGQGQGEQQEVSP